jgi:hypothetical protein
VGLGNWRLIVWRGIHLLTLDFWEASLKNLSTEGLIDLARDAETRIGSHVAGGNPIDAYVQRQQALLELIQDELGRR